MEIDYIFPTHEYQVYKSPFCDSHEQPSKAKQRKSDQRKKLLAFEINFIISCVEAHSKIVYIGETIQIKNGVQNHGENIYVLAKMFPFLTFHVYDDEEFSENYLPQLRDLSNVTIFGRMPTDEEIDFYKDENTYLIANIVEKSVRIERTYDEIKNKDAVEEIKRIHEEKSEFFKIKEKMNLLSLRKSMNLVKKMCPKSSLLRFRPNHKDVTSFEFFDGILMLPIFSDEKSAECRLIVNFEHIDLTTNWNFEHLFANLNYWNDKERERSSLNPFTGTGEPLLSYGNRMEYCIFFAILREYFKTISYPYATVYDIERLMELYINVKF